MTTQEFCTRMGDKIRELRIDKGLSQEELGGKVGLHRNTVMGYENGKDIPVMVFIRICVALGMPAGAVLDGVLIEKGSIAAGKETEGSV